VIKAYVDGGSRGNPGEAAIGFILINGEGRELYRFGKKVGICTNNAAEYLAIYELLKYIMEECPGNIRKEPITIYSDSELLVKQINGEYRVKNLKLIEMHKKVCAILEQLPCVNIKYLSRKENITADWIVNRVLDSKTYRPADRSQEYSAPEESPGS